MAAQFPGSASFQGLFDEGNRWTVMLPLTMMLVLSVANAFIFVPKATSVMWKLRLGMLMRWLSLKHTNYGSDADDDQTLLVRKKPVRKQTLNPKKKRLSMV